MNFYPTYYTLIPAAVLMGMGAGPLWSAQGTHLTTSAMNLADITSETHEAVISRFNGVFFLFFLASQIPGNLVSSLVLFSGVNGGNANETDLSFCGANDCGAAANSSSSDLPDQTTVYILFGTLLAWGTLSIPMAAFFMNPLPSYCPVLPVKRSALEQLKATFRLALSPRMFLLIPLIVYNGLELGFAYGDFTKAFISCTQGVQTIGFVMTAYGIGGGISALFLGIINKYTGRLPIFTVGFLSQVVLITMMLFWDPYQGQLWHLYLMAVAWAFGGVLPFFGVLFPKDQEPAFANFRFWQAIAYSLAFAFSIPDFMCVSYTLSALLGILCLGMGLYYLLEWRIRHEESVYKTPVQKETGTEEVQEKQVATAFFGVLFPKDQEPAFANFRFWQAIAYSLAFAFSIPDFMCVSYTLSALLGILCLGMGLYYLLEWRIRHEESVYKTPVQKETGTEEVQEKQEATGDKVELTSM
ncbi:protein unc-93 homolog A-like [Amphiura filiformis]|uniref:protein unc-93 homolog A-like n=1 Tax=Amphiura filiformis TaxID=82378 RepID=UPI003B20F158